METDVLTPTFDPGTIHEIVFSYWGKDDDIACIHINERRSAFTIEVDGGIYLREDGGKVIGLEVHEFSRAFAGSPTLSAVVIPAIAEVETLSGGRLDESFEVQAAVEELPLTKAMLVVVIEHALGAHKAELRAELAGTVRASAGGDP